MTLINYMGKDYPLDTIVEALPLFDEMGEFITHLNVRYSFTHTFDNFFNNDDPCIHRELYSWIDIDVLTENLLNECINDLKKAASIYKNIRSEKIILKLVNIKHLEDWRNLWKD